MSFWIVKIRAVLQQKQTFGDSSFISCSTTPDQFGWKACHENNICGRVQERISLLVVILLLLYWMRGCNLYQFCRCFLIWVETEAFFFFVFIASWHRHHQRRTWLCPGLGKKECGNWRCIRPQSVYCIEIFDSFRINGYKILLSKTSNWVFLKTHTKISSFHWQRLALCRPKVVYV